MNRAINTSVALLGLGVVAAAASADTIAYTSFEEQPVFTVQYVDTLDAGIDHALLDNPGEPYVNWTYNGGELGFSSYYRNTRNDVGLTDGDFVGTTDFVGVVGAYTDGEQGFEISDSDGLMTTTLDTVSLAGYMNLSVCVDFFAQETGWEEDDYLRIWVTVDGSTDLDLINTTGSDIDDLGIEGAWITSQISLDGYSTAQLHFELESNSSSEALYIDNILFKGTPIPTPGSILLLGLGGAVLGRRRRNR